MYGSSKNKKNYVRFAVVVVAATMLFGCRLRAMDEELRQEETLLSMDSIDGLKLYYENGGKTPHNRRSSFLNDGCRLPECLLKRKHREAIDWFNEIVAARDECTVMCLENSNTCLLMSALRKKLERYPHPRYNVVLVGDVFSSYISAAMDLQKTEINVAKQLNFTQEDVAQQHQRFRGIFRSFKKRFPRPIANARFDCPDAGLLNRAALFSFSSASGWSKILSLNTGTSTAFLRSVICFIISKVEADTGTNTRANSNKTTLLLLLSKRKRITLLPFL